MKILVTGANGLIGQYLTAQLLDKQHTVIATGLGPTRLPFIQNEQYTYQELDITDGPLVNRLLTEHRPEIVIHAAAMTQVDVCEENKTASWNVNVMATRFLINAAKEINAWFIFLSTDFVFDGLNAPYAEDAKLNPVNHYGNTKREGEKAVAESGLNWTIIRTVLVAGNPLKGTRQNIVTWVRNKLENGQPVKMVHDQYRTPTFVDDLVNGVLLVLEKRAYGIFHISGKDELTPYAIAIETARLLNLDETLIAKTDSASLSELAIRPPKTIFLIEKAHKELGYQPHSFTESLRKMFNGQV